MDLIIFFEKYFFGVFCGGRTPDMRCRLRADLSSGLKFGPKSRFFRFLRGIGGQGGGKNSKIVNSFGDLMDISLKPVCTNFGEIPTNYQPSNLLGANFVDFETGLC